MSRYTVVWRDVALDELAQIRVESKDRARVTAAIASIDAELANDPPAKGEELHEGLRMFRSSTLHVLFEVQELDRLVRVVEVRSARQAGE